MASIVVSLLHSLRFLVQPRASMHLEIIGSATSSRSQTWRTFLRNHASQIMTADVFIVPTITFRLLYVLVIVAHERRRIVRVAVTEHPTAPWTAQQLRNAFPEDEAPRYLCMIATGRLRRSRPRSPP